MDTQKSPENFSEVEASLKTSLKKFQNLNQNMAVRSKVSYDNSQTILSIFIKMVTYSFKPLEYLLKFMTDKEILSVAATCKTLFRLTYSPFGYKVIKFLRPITIIVQKQPEIPTYNKNYLENLCNDVNMAGVDEDDQIALIMTMKTNLMVARQKAKQLEFSNQEWQKRKTDIIRQMSIVGVLRDEENKKIDDLGEQIEKMIEVLQESQKNIERLKFQQQKMLDERTQRQQNLQVERVKLNRQKDLLIKKIKSQQKEREEGLIYAREVARITTLLNKITSKK